VAVFTKIENKNRKMFSHRAQNEKIYCAILQKTGVFCPKNASVLAIFHKSHIFS